MKDEDIFLEASKKVKAKKGFFVHLISYVAVLGILYAIMYFENQGGGLLPIVIVALSWGIGIAIHYFNVFGTENLEILGINPDWEEHELEEEIEKLKRKRELKERLREERRLLDLEEGLELKEIEKKPLDNNNEYIS